MSARSLVRETTRPTIALGLICALIALVLLPQAARAASAAPTSGVPSIAARGVATEVDKEKGKEKGKGPKRPRPGKADVDEETARRFGEAAEQAGEDLGLNGEMGTTAAQEKFHSGPFAYQWGPECLNGGVTQYATTAIGYYGATDGSTPQLNQTYYMGMIVGAGLPCNGRIASTLKVYPPKGTTIAIDAANGVRVRCFAETNTPRHEVTNDSSADCKAMPAGDGSWYLGTRPLGSGWMFEIYVPVRSSQPLRGMSGANGGDWWTGHSEVWTASPSVAYPKAIAWAGGGMPDIGISYPNPSATEVVCNTAMTTGYLFSQYTSGQAWLQIGTQAGSYPDAAGPVTIGAENQAYTVWARGWGLQPNTTYHWRLIYNSNGQWYLGADQVFTTTSECDPPTGSVTINAGHPATRSTSVNLSLTATDASGVSQMRLSNDGAEWSAWETFAATRAWTITDGDGTKTVHVQYRDRLGNESTAVTDTIALDTVAPSGSITVEGGEGTTKTRDVTLTLSASDDASGVSLMRFSNDGTTWSAWRSYATSTAWTLSAGDGTKTVHAQFHDAAGNLSTVATDTITLQEPVADTTPPTGSIVVAQGAAYTRTLAVAVALAAQDASGRISMRLSNDGTTWTAWEPFASSRTWGLLAGDGLKTVRVQYRDAAGNLSALRSDTITLDRTAPVARVPAAVLNPIVGGLPAAAPGGKTPVKVSWALATDANGISRYILQMSTNGGAWTTIGLRTATSTSAELLLAPASYRFRLQAIDRAGNASAWVGGTTPTVIAAYNETATTPDGTGTKVTYGAGWLQGALTGAFGGAVRHASGAGATATFTFTGKQVAFVSTLGPRGKVEILLDGVRITPVGGLDLYRSGAAQPARVIVVRAVGTGTHTLTIKVLGTKNSGAGATTRIDVDAFLVLR